jgi:predicted GIY-YIG superfamily endonuclease
MPPIESPARAPLRYSVYVIELAPEVRERRGCPPANGKPAVYVGQTADTPEERFAEHLAGHRAARIVRDHGVRLRPRLYLNYGPYATREEAETAEAHLAERLRRRGFCVFGGH